MTIQRAMILTGRKILVLVCFDGYHKGNIVSPRWMKWRCISINCTCAQRGLDQTRVQPTTTSPTPTTGTFPRLSFALSRGLRHSWSLVLSSTVHAENHSIIITSALLDHLIPLSHRLNKHSSLAPFASSHLTRTTFKLKQSRLESWILISLARTIVLYIEHVVYRRWSRC
jgi:hypothetical protein